MLFIRVYDTKSLDRSSVSMIDKYNTRLNKVDELLDELSLLIENLLSLVRDIRNTLGQCKQRVYNNLDQVKEVIDGNGITGTESTIDAIEDALKAGDKAIDEAEEQLEDIELSINCNEEYIQDNVGGIECGEACNEEADFDKDDVCNFSIQSTTPGGGGFDCTVCAQGDCTVDLSCNESGVNYNGGSGGCNHSEYCSQGQFGCDETLSIDKTCGEFNCNHSGDSFNIPDGCPFTCGHSSGCQETPMPENCIHTCIDGDGCGYSDDDCSYSSICGQEESCNEISCGQYDCGEPCGETCHQDNNEDCNEDCSEDCSEDSCGEDCGDYSDDDYYGGDDCGEACGEDCGDSCGLV